jgi:hypothetical protein
MKSPFVMLSVLSGIVFVGCAKSPHVASNAIDLSKIQGEWVVVGDTSGRGDTGHMTLKSDGTYTSDYTMPASSDGKTKSSTETFSGTYTVHEDSLVGAKVTKVELKILVDNGKPTKVNGPLQLFYDPVGNMLHDFVTVAYARPGDEQRALDRLKRK